MPEGKPLLLLILVTAALHFTWAQQSLETEYLTPAPPGHSEHRHHCQGFSQLEPLKGEWVEHHDPNYMGMTAGKPCPSFFHDFDCLHPYTPGPYYEELGRRVCPLTFSSLTANYAFVLLPFPSSAAAAHFSCSCCAGRQSTCMYVTQVSNRSG